MLQDGIPFSLSQFQTDMILEPKFTIWSLGIVLLFVGARYYQLLIMAPGFAVGVMLAMKNFPFDGILLFLAAMVLGSIGAVLLVSIEKLSVAIAGAFVGIGVVYSLEPYLFAGKAPFYVAAIASLIGSMIFPKLYDDLRPVVCALSGAMCIAWAVNKQNDVIAIVVLSCVGALVQYLVTARGIKKSVLS